MRYILAFSLLAYSSVAIATGELSFSATDTQEPRVQKPATLPTDPNIEAQFNAPEEPIPPPRLLPVDDPPQHSTVVRPAMRAQSPTPAVARTLPTKRMVAFPPRQLVQRQLVQQRVAHPQYAKLIRRKTMVASFNRRRLGPQASHAITAHKRPTYKKVGTFKPKKMV